MWELLDGCCAVRHLGATCKGSSSIFPVSQILLMQVASPGKKEDAEEKISTKFSSLKWPILKLAAVQLALHMLVEKACTLPKDGHTLIRQ